MVGDHPSVAAGTVEPEPEAQSVGASPTEGEELGGAKRKRSGSSTPAMRAALRTASESPNRTQRAHHRGPAGALRQPHLRPDDGLPCPSPGRLERSLRELQPTGAGLHIHAIGDRGARAALDAIEAVQADLGPARHRLTQVELLHPDDVPPFAELGVTGDLQKSPPWGIPAGSTTTSSSSERTASVPEAGLWPTLRTSGANALRSSDDDVGDLSPSGGMARAVDRGEPSLPSVQAALEAYTTNTAFLLRQEDLVGSLKQG